MMRVASASWRQGRTLAASDTLLAEDKLLGSLPDAALDGSREQHASIATSLTILDAMDADKIFHIYSAILNGF